MSDELTKRIEELEDEVADLSAQLIALAEYSHEQTVSTRAMIGIMIAILAPKTKRHSSPNIGPR